jgi:Flp pilus assembly protein TadD
MPVGHAGSRIAHHATAHKRRFAKRERHDKHARREKRSARATQVASEAAPTSDADARATYARGNALLFAGDASGAIAAYRKAIELAPADPIGYRGLGLAYEQRGDTSAALKALRKYLKRAPGAADREIISRRIDRLSRTAK